MIWARAQGCRVTLVDGRELLDLTGGFGVAALGHRNPHILQAWREQEVVHALGDLADAEVTVRLREALPRPAKLGVTGEDAVEIALRTALLATGRPGIVAFEGAYHGTGLLALAATGFDRFREPFAPWLPGPVHRRAFGEDPGPLPEDAGCVIVEPVQGRAGSRVPPEGFLETLRGRCDEAGALLLVDSIFCGLGRVGEMWPGEEVADVLCVGKALGGGLPLSAALFYRDGLEEVWRLGPEDVYTHTHVGNPLACAAALVVLEEAYYNYVQRPDYPRSLDYVRAGRNVLVLRTFSKVHGLAGLRIGYGMGYPELIEALNRIRSPFNANSLAQSAARAALGDREHVARSVEVNAREMKFVPCDGAPRTSRADRRRGVTEARRSGAAGVRHP